MRDWEGREVDNNQSHIVNQISTTVISVVLSRSTSSQQSRSVKLGLGSVRNSRRWACQRRGYLLWN